MRVEKRTLPVAVRLVRGRAVHIEMVPPAGELQTIEPEVLGLRGQFRQG